MWDLNILKYNSQDNYYDIYKNIGVFDTDQCISTANDIVQKYCKFAKHDTHKWQVENEKFDDVDIAELLTIDNIVNKMFYEFDINDNYRLEISTHKSNPNIDVDWLVRDLIWTMRS